MTNLTLKIFGKTVKKLRTDAGVSQEELGFRTGLDRTYISGVERGIRNPSFKTIEKIAKSLGVSMKLLFEESHD